MNGIVRCGRVKISPFSPPVTRPGENDDVEDLAEDQRGDGEIDVAQPGGEIGDEQRRAGGAGEPEQDGEPEIGRTDQEQRGAGAVHAEAEEGRMAERDHAGVADQQIGRHRQQAPDQDFGEKAAPEFRQHQRRRGEHGDHHAKADPENRAVAQSGLAERQRFVERCGCCHFGVGTNRPVGRNSSVRISTTKDTITACEGSIQIVA